MRRFLVTLAITAIVVTCPATGYGKCGVERWNVKVGRDPAAKTIDLSSPTQMSIAALRGLSRPSSLPDTRITGVETTVYQVSGRIIHFKRETDSDYHVVISDDSGNTIIVEIPSPTCATRSPWHDSILDVRTEFDEQLGPVSSQFQDVDIPVTITGVGFFDIDHGQPGQVGHAPNNFEIHPVLAMEFPEVAPGPPGAPARPTTIRTTTAAGAGCPECPAPTPSPTASTLFWIIAALMTILYAGLLIGVIKNLSDPNNPWSLSRALSEDGKPSSSRLIAFVGMLVLMVIYIGISYVAVWRLLNNQLLPDISGFLLTGLSLFAPYAANQLKNMVTGAVGGAGGGGGSAGGGGARPGGTAPAPSSPKVLSVTPNSVSGGASTTLVVAGSGFDPKATVVVTTPSGPVSPAATITATQAQFPILMPAATMPYIATVNITNPDGGHTTGSFQVT
jgi:hypothetical protein